MPIAINLVEVVFEVLIISPVNRRSLRIWRLKQNREYSNRKWWIWRKIIGACLSWHHNQCYMLIKQEFGGWWEIGFSRRKWDPSFWELHVRNYYSITVVDCMQLWDQWLQMGDSSLSCENFGERKQTSFKRELEVIWLIRFCKIEVVVQFQFRSVKR
jgi:hypothetical protein